MMIGEFIEALPTRRADVVWRLVHRQNRRRCGWKRRLLVQIIWV
jgi:hypothetical protein